MADFFLLGHGLMGRFNTRFNGRFNAPLKLTGLMAGLMAGLMPTCSMPVLMPRFNGPG